MFGYFDLAANVVFASTFLLSIKWVQSRRREDIIVVGCVNYIAAALGALPQFVLTGFSHGSPTAYVLGATLGVAYFTAFFFVIRMVKWIGAAASNVVSVLSILLPISCGVFIWGEEPNRLQVFGIGFAFVALLLISSQRIELPANHRPWKTFALIACFFLLAGLSRLSQEAFKHECQPDERSTFLFSAFVTAAIPSVLLLSRYRKQWQTSEFLCGGFVGSANYLQTIFILRALGSFPGFIVFPVTSAGGLVLTTLVATRMMHEKLHLRSYIGIAITVVALVLLNL